jgi:hypothetical protein
MCGRTHGQNFVRADESREEVDVVDVGCGNRLQRSVAQYKTVGCLLMTPVESSGGGGRQVFVRSTFGYCRSD